MLDLLDYRKNVYSSEGEDGIIEKIFNILDIKEGFFCEFGAWDGILGSNTRNLLQNGWKGVYIESDTERFLSCLQNTKQFNNNAICFNTTVSHEEETLKLDNILKNTFLPIDFDFLSIDIDSSDYQVWESIECYKPKLVVIEIDSTHDDTIHSIYNPTERTTTSYRSMLELGSRKGYKILCSTGNMFFLRNDLEFPLTNPYHQNLNYMNWRI